MEVERNASLPFIGSEQLNVALRIKSKVQVRLANTVLLLHYQGHVNNRYKHCLITTTLDRANRISSNLSYFSQEWDRLETVLLKYPSHLFNLAVNQFIDFRVSDHQHTPSTETTTPTIHVTIPLKY